jgi:glycosyltransferase involved in cell wall biosynthesis
MRVLYIAGAVEANGRSGGSTHIREVACGLKGLGHDVIVMARAAPDTPRPPVLDCGVRVRYLRWRKELALLGLPQVARAVRGFRPDVVMERYYNFAGAGILLARRRHIPSILEVNAPMVDPPGTLKSRLDRVLLGVMRRWAVRQAVWSAAIVTPLASTVPPEVTRRKIHELPWGANIERFDPSIRASRQYRLARLRRALGLADGMPVAVFLGSFRAWHGVGHFAQAARMLIERDVPLAFLTIGGGPELPALKAEVDGWGLPRGRFVFAGPRAHEEVPELLALADIGVAPFDLAAHPPLITFGFYWSPLKVFEYMAMALPVVTVDVAPLNEIVRHEQEGLLYPSGDVQALAWSIEQLAADPGLRQRLGSSARERVVQHYSWQAHCRSLDAILREAAREREFAPVRRKIARVR